MKSLIIVIITTSFTTIMIMIQSTVSFQHPPIPSTIIPTAGLTVFHHSQTKPLPKRPRLLKNTLVKSPQRIKRIMSLSSSNGNNYNQKDNNNHNNPETNDSTISISPLYLHHTAIKTRNIEMAIAFYSLFGFEIETKFRTGPCRAVWLTNANTLLANQKKNEELQTQNNISNSDSKVIASRLEILEVPAYLLQESEEGGKRKRAIDLLEYPSLLGLNHYALDVTSFIAEKMIPKNTMSTAHPNDHHDESSSDNNNNHGTSDNNTTNEIQPSSSSLLSYGLDQFLQHINQISIQKFGKTLRIAVPPKQQVIGNQVFEVAFVYDYDGTLMELIRFIKYLDQDVDCGWEPWNGKGFVQ